MRGEIVVCKDFKGEPLVRRVWAATDEHVYITDDAGFARLSEGVGTDPIPFPRCDVYICPRNFDPAKIDWKALESWASR